MKDTLLAFILNDGMKKQITQVNTIHKLFISNDIFTAKEIVLYSK